MPVALAGCGRKNGRAARIPPGEMAGASVGIGHRLRDGLKAEVPQDDWQDTRVLIVGAGMAGLSAARKLRKAGVDDFVLLELEPKPGGTSQFGSRKDAVVPYPWGAHYLPAPTRENPELIALLEEMHVLEGRTEAGDPIVAEPFLCRAPQERIYYQGQWFEGLYPGVNASSEDLRQFAAFQTEIDHWVNWRDGKGRRAFTLPRANGSDDAEIKELDRFTMAEWMDRQGWNSAKLRWWVDFACRDDYGLRLHQTSAWAGLFYFVSRKPEAGKPSRPFITWPEGNGRIVKHLTAGLKDRLQTGWAVLDINPVNRNGRCGVDVVAVNHEGTKARGFRAERVIFAAPQFLAPYVIQPYRGQPPAHVKAFQYGSWAVANLVLKDRPAEAEADYPLCWDNVFSESQSLGYVSATHQRGLDYGPTVFTWYYPLCDDDPRKARERLLATDRDQWADIALADMEIAHPEIRDLTERLDVMRWGHAMIRPVPGFAWSIARERAAKPFRGIHFAHSDLSGLALFEEAFAQGNRAAEELLSDEDLKLAVPG